MPIVFVHGVRTRPGDEWEEQGRTRRSLLQTFALKELVPDPAATFYEEPLWGDLAAAPRWEHASLPGGRDVEEFDLEDDPDAPVAAALVEAGAEPLPDVPEPRQVLEQTRLAVELSADEERKPLETLLDSLLAVAASEADDDELEELATFGIRAAEYARSNPPLAWLNDVEDDVQLVNVFTDKVEEAVPDPSAVEASTDESFSFQSARARFVEAVERVGNVSERLAGRAFTALTRTAAHKGAAMFLGDVVVYLNERGSAENPGAIVRTVAASIERAQAAKRDPEDPKLIVIAHSMGGNIVYDLLTHFRPDLHVDTFVTVGSQVAFFEELAQFRSSPPDPPADPDEDRIERPQNVGRWINVFDLNDVLGFAAAGVYNGVEDFAYSTGKGALKAHGAYLMLPSFHIRLRERLRKSW